MAGCADDPSANYLGGFGDPLRGAALYAPRNLGDTSRWAGRPAEAAVAAEQVEFLTSGLPASPRYAPELNPAVVQQLEVARAEMRAYLGIAPAADPALVIAALRRAAESLRAGSRAKAEAALADPAFTAGPPARWPGWTPCLACPAPPRRPGWSPPTSTAWTAGADPSHA